MSEKLIEKEVSELANHGVENKSEAPNPTRDTEAPSQHEPLKTENEVVEKIPSPRANFNTEDGDVHSPNTTFEFGKLEEGAFFSCSNSFVVDSLDDEPPPKTKVMMLGPKARKSLQGEKVPFSPSTLISAFEKLKIVSTGNDSTFESEIDFSFENGEVLDLPESLDLALQNLKNLQSEDGKEDQENSIPGMENVHALTPTTQENQHQVKQIDGYQAKQTLEEVEKETKESTEKVVNGTFVSNDTFNAENQELIDTEEITVHALTPTAGATREDQDQEKQVQNAENVDHYQAKQTLEEVEKETKESAEKVVNGTFVSNVTFNAENQEIIDLKEITVDAFAASAEATQDQDQEKQVQKAGDEDHQAKHTLEGGEKEIQESAENVANETFNAENQELIDAEEITVHALTATAGATQEDQDQEKQVQNAENIDHQAKQTLEEGEKETTKFAGNVANGTFVSNDTFNAENQEPIDVIKITDHALSPTVEVAKDLEKQVSKAEDAEQQPQEVDGQSGLHTEDQEKVPIKDADKTVNGEVENVILDQDLKDFAGQKTVTDLSKLIPDQKEYIQSQTSEEVPETKETTEEEKNLLVRELKGTFVDIFGQIDQSSQEVVRSEHREQKESSEFPNDQNEVSFGNKSSQIESECSSDMELEPDCESSIEINVSVEAPDSPHNKGPAEQVITTEDQVKIVEEQAQKETTSGVFNFVQKISSLVFSSAPAPVKEKSSQDSSVNMEIDIIGIDKEVEQISIQEVAAENEIASQNCPLLEVPVAQTEEDESLKDDVFEKPEFEKVGEFSTNESERVGGAADENLDLQPLPRRRLSSGVVMTSMDYLYSSPNAEFRHIEEQYDNDMELPGYEQYLDLKLDINRLQQAVATLFVDIKHKEGQILELFPEKVKVNPSGEKLQGRALENKPRYEEDKVKLLETEIKKLREQLAAKDDDHANLQKCMVEADIILDQYMHRLNDTESKLKSEKLMTKRMGDNLNKVMASYETYKNIAVTVQSNEIVYKESIEKLKVENYKLRENYKKLMDQISEANKENQRLESCGNGTQKFPAKRN